MAKRKAATKAKAAIKVVEDKAATEAKTPTKPGKFWDTKPEGKGPTKPCPACGKWHHPRAASCPACGHEYPARPRKAKKVKAERTPKTSLAAASVDRNGLYAGKGAASPADAILDLAAIVGVDKARQILGAVRG